MTVGLVLLTVGLSLLVMQHSNLSPGTLGLVLAALGGAFIFAAVT